MELNNPFDDPQGQFYLLRNAQQQYSLWPQQCALPIGWDVISDAQSLAACQQWLISHWQILTPHHYQQRNRLCHQEDA